MYIFHVSMYITRRTIISTVKSPDNCATDQDRHRARGRAQQLLDGLIWTGLTCSAGLAGYHISSHLFDDNIGVITGALCSITTGGGLLYFNVIPPGKQ